MELILLLLEEKELLLLPRECATSTLLFLIFLVYAFVLNFLKHQGLAYRRLCGPLERRLTLHEIVLSWVIYLVEIALGQGLVVGIQRFLDGQLAGGQQGVRVSTLFEVGVIDLVRRSIVDALRLVEVIQHGLALLLSGNIKSDHLGSTLGIHLKRDRLLPIRS